MRVSWFERVEMGDTMAKIMVLSFSDKEEDTYQRMLQVVSNSKNFEWCNMIQDTKSIQLGKLKIDLYKRSVTIENSEVISYPVSWSCSARAFCDSFLSVRSSITL